MSSMLCETFKLSPAPDVPSQAFEQQCCILQDVPEVDLLRLLCERIEPFHTDRLAVSLLRHAARFGNLLEEFYRFPAWASHSGPNMFNSPGSCCIVFACSPAFAGCPARI